MPAAERSIKSGPQLISKEEVQALEVRLHGMQKVRMWPRRSVLQSHQKCVNLMNRELLF